MNLFIDTNIFLSFYHLSSDDLEELQKLGVLIDQGRLKLYLPDQVIDEFRRNRDNKIADAIKRFRDEKLSDQFPQMCKDYEEYEEMREAIKQFKKAKSQLLDKLTTDISQEKLKADQIIQELFDKADRIEVTEEVVNRARLRYDLGNPPGKKGSYGDAVNWECLLATVGDGQDLYFVAGDQDYCSEIDKEEFSPFLRHEWVNRKESTILFFKRLSAFFKDQFPDIQLAQELERELLIEDLLNSPRFASTRQTLRNLVKYSDFTDTQLNDIVLAAISNNQVYWIIEDRDINRCLRRIIKGNEDRITPENLERLLKLLDGEENDF